MKTMDIEQYMHNIGRQAREASRFIARADSNVKNNALRIIAAALRRESAAPIAANCEDLGCGARSGS